MWRINHNWCTTTQSILNRSASEQITYTKDLVDCVRPMYRDIHLTFLRLPGPTYSLTFNGCCGNQCLISGQRYTFNITYTYVNNTGVTTGVNIGIFTLTWCPGITNIFPRVSFNVPANSTASITRAYTFDVPNVECKGVGSLLIDTSSPFNQTLRLGYCEKAFKKPYMLGSCAGR